MGVDWLDGTKAAALKPAARLRQLLTSKGVATVGAHDGMSALLAKNTGFEALYLSGAALSASMALPDLGLLTLDDVGRRAREIVRASGLPLIVDCDTGFGEALNVMRMVREMEDYGVACVQIEDQLLPKKCGHLNDKKLASMDDMCAKIIAAKRAATGIVICARTDAASVSLDEAIKRANAYARCGAELIFVEALTSIEAIARVRREVKAPLLANMTEFGRTPQISLKAWAEHGYEIVIYPVSSFRIASKAIGGFYGALKANGDAVSSLPNMMTRAELYDTIHYYDYEKLDQSIAATCLPHVE
jgi:methylisocitrate lyase